MKRISRFIGITLLVLSCLSSCKSRNKGTNYGLESHCPVADTLYAGVSATKNDVDVLPGLTPLAKRVADISFVQDTRRYVGSVDDVDTVQVRLEMLYSDEGNRIFVEKKRNGKQLMKRSITPADLLRIEKSVYEMSDSDIIKSVSLFEIKEYTNPTLKERYGNSITIRAVIGSDDTNIGTAAGNITIDDSGNLQKLSNETYSYLDLGDPYVKKHRSQIDTLYSAWSKGKGMQESERYYAGRDSCEVYIDVLRNGSVLYWNDYEYYREMSCKVEWYSKGRPVIPERTIVTQDLIDVVYPGREYSYDTFPGLIDVWIKSADKKKLNLVALVGLPGHEELSALDVVLYADGRLEGSLIEFPETVELQSDESLLRLAKAEELPAIDEIDYEVSYRSDDALLRVVSAQGKHYIDFLYGQGECWPYLELSTPGDGLKEMSIVQAKDGVIEILVDGAIYAIRHQGDSAVVRPRIVKENCSTANPFDGRRIDLDKINLPQPTPEFAGLGMVHYGDSVVYQADGQTEEVTCTVTSRSDYVDGKIVEVCDTSVVYLKQLNSGKLTKNPHGYLLGESRCYFEWYINGECVVPCVEITTERMHPYDIIFSAFVCDGGSGGEIVLKLYIGVPDSDLLFYDMLRVSRDGKLYHRVL